MLASMTKALRGITTEGAKWGCYKIDLFPALVTERLAQLIATHTAFRKE